MENLVQVAEGQVVVSSRQVADHFEKRHTHVLTVIKEILNSAENSAQWFFKAEYKDASGKSNPEYLMNRDGFSLLVMGFTGKKALEWKIKYIQAFNAMEEELRRGGTPYVLIMKHYKKHPVLTSADVAALLGMARESVSQALQQPLARCKHGRDYFLVQGDDLAVLKHDNPSISSLASSVLLIAESGLRKICAYLKRAMPAVFGDPPVVDVLPVQVTNPLNTYAAPESNKEIGAWVKDIRGYMDVLDGLLHKYEQQNPIKTQEALKEVMRSVGKDIWEDVVRLTCQKYDLVTV